LQCRALHELPWGDAIQADEIELLIGAPVQDEIDRLKGDGNSRRARRAREANGLFRSVLGSLDESLPLRESSPKVILRFAPTLPPKRETVEALDLSRPDDQLLDEVMHFRHTEPSAQILSGDTGMALRARRLRVPVIAVPDSWLLPPEKDERDRKIHALEAQITALRSTEAELALSLTNEAGQELEAIDGSLPQYPDLTESETVGLTEEIRRRHPEVKTFESAPTNAPASPQLEGLQRLFEQMSSWQAPSSDQISRYQREYTEWVEKARKRLEQFGSFLNIRNRLRRVRVYLANNSSRPADEVLVEIRVHGSVTLLASVGDVAPDLIAQAEGLPLEVLLSPPPIAPKGEYLYERVGRIANFGREHVDIATKLSRYTMPDYSGIRSRFEPRDRHRFYRREEDDKPVSEASFTCEEFRHQRAPEVFDLWIIVPIQSERGEGKLHIRASARNMTTPVDVYMPIDLKAETRSTYDIASKWRIEG